MSITEKCQDRREKKRWTMQPQVQQLSMLDSRSLACNDPPVVLHLGLAGIELVFFTVAPMVLCFGFVTKTVVTAHDCLHHCWSVPAQHQGFLCFLLHLAKEQDGVGKRTQLDDPNRPHNPTPYNVMLSNKNEGLFWQASHCNIWDQQAPHKG